MLKQQNTAIYVSWKQCQVQQWGLFTQLFELLIGAMWAIVTVLALMVKQEYCMSQTALWLVNKELMFQDG